MSASPVKRACVIGWPIGQSRLPLIYDHWFREHGIEAGYTKEPVAPDDLATFLGGMMQSHLMPRSADANAGGVARDGSGGNPPGFGLIGCDVAPPHKERAFELADWRDAGALALRAATAVWVENGQLCAMNTDSYAFMANLDQSVPVWRHAPGVAMVFGVGTMARAIVHGLLSGSDMPVAILNHSRVRAEIFAQTFRDMGRFEPSRIVVADWDRRQEIGQDAALIVDTAMIGIGGRKQLDLDLELVPDTCVVTEIGYAARESDLLAEARARGLMAVDGLGMALYQVSPGFERWFGVRPQVSDTLRRLVAADLE